MEIQRRDAWLREVIGLVHREAESRGVIWDAGAPPGHRPMRPHPWPTPSTSRQWPEMLAGDEILATAILDRLLHHCHVVNIDGRSFRLKTMAAQVNSR